MFLSAGEYVTKTTARHSDQFSLLLSSSLSGFNFVGLRKFCFITHCCQQVTSNQVMGKMFNKFVVILSQLNKVKSIVQDNYLPME